MNPVTIGITDCSSYENYHRWISQEKNVEIVRLGHHQNNLEDIRKCDGILLSGGEDVHPRRYGKRELLDHCHEIDEPRDEFEWKVLDFTVKNQLPLLGICRGLQVANVYLGGTLVPHIPLAGKFDHAKVGPVDRYHGIKVDPNSGLNGIVGAIEGEINSAHHQAADRIADGLVANALSPDGVVEGLERLDSKDKVFFLLVQWHPERMTNLNSPFSKNIRQKFVEGVRKGKG